MVYMHNITKQLVGMVTLCLRLKVCPSPNADDIVIMMMIILYYRSDLARNALVLQKLDPADQVHPDQQEDEQSVLAEAKPLCTTNGLY